MRYFRLRSAVIAFLLMSSAKIHAQENWPMYGRDLQHTFSNSASQITPGNVASLKLAWTFPTSDAISASPTVAGGVLYVGAWDGFFYALDARTGSMKWKFPVDCDNTIVPVPPQCLAPGEKPPPRFLTLGGLITSTAAVVDGQVYFAAGKTVYDLDAADGSLRWKHVICGNPDEPNCRADKNDPTQIFSSPAVFGGLVFIGHTVNGTVGYRGAIEALDAETGVQRWRFEVDPIVNAQGQPILDKAGHAIGGYNRGCGAVWSSAAVDAGLGLVYFGTGDCNTDPTPPYHETILALDAATGALVSLYRPPDVLYGCDEDFGASPNLIRFGDRRYLGEGGKDGTYYLLDAASLDLVWARHVVFGGSEGGFFGASFDGRRIFAATSLGDGNIYTQTGLCDPSNPADTFLQEPSLHAFDIRGGGIAWEQTHNHSVAPTSIANGVVFSGLIGIEGFGVNAYDARSGQLLVQLPIALSKPGSVNSAATPLGKYLYITSGTSTDGSGSGVLAFVLPGNGD
jgi:outer membrane protein assembly factor BamB